MESRKINDRREIKFNNKNLINNNTKRDKARMRYQNLIFSCQNLYDFERVKIVES